MKSPANAIDVNPQCYDQLQPWVTSVERQNANVCAPFLPNVSTKNSNQADVAIKNRGLKEDTDVKNIYQANSAESSFQEETACKMAVSSKQANIHEANSAESSFQEETACKMAVSSKQANIHEANSAESSFQEETACKMVHEVSLLTESVPSEVDSSGSYFLSDTKLGCLFTNEPNQTVSLTAREKTAAIADSNIYEDINDIHGFKSHKTIQDHHYSLPHNTSSSEQIDSNLAFPELDFLHD